jgi:hypothetical protein
MTGALEGLFGPRLELFDLYLTRSGWEAIDALTWVTVALSALASLLWWIFARGIYALVQRLLRGRVAASVKRWNKQKKPPHDVRRFCSDGNSLLGRGRGGAAL